MRELFRHIWDSLEGESLSAKEVSVPIRAILVMVTLFLLLGFIGFLVAICGTDIIGPQRFEGPYTAP